MFYGELYRSPQALLQGLGDFFQLRVTYFTRCHQLRVDFALGISAQRLVLRSDTGQDQHTPVVDQQTYKIDCLGIDPSLA